MLVSWQGAGSAEMVTMSGAFERVGWGRVQYSTLNSQDNRIAPVEGRVPQKQHLAYQIIMFVRLLTKFTKPKLANQLGWARTSNQDLILY